MRKVCWLSAGVSSFIAGWLEKEKNEVKDEIITINMSEIRRIRKAG